MINQVSQISEHSIACHNLNHDYEDILGMRFCRNCGHHYCFNNSITKDAIKTIHEFRSVHVKEIRSLEHCAKNELTLEEANLFDLLDTFVRNECYFTAVNINAAIEPDKDKQLIVHKHYHLLYPIAKATAQLEKLITSGRVGSILQRMYDIK